MHASNRRQIQMLARQVLRPIQRPQHDVTNVAVEYYGERVWRRNGVSDEEIEKSAATTLLYKELEQDLQTPIMHLLLAAAAYMHKYSCERSRRSVLVRLADEYVICGELGKALPLYTAAVSEYRREGWHELAAAPLVGALYCAFATAAVKEYITLALYAISSLSPLVPTQISATANSLVAIANGQAPQLRDCPLPSLSMAPVSGAENLWQRILANALRVQIDMNELPVKEMHFLSKALSPIRRFAVFWHDHSSTLMKYQCLVTRRRLLQKYTLQWQ